MCVQRSCCPAASRHRSADRLACVSVSSLALLQRSVGAGVGSTNNRHMAGYPASAHGHPTQTGRARTMMRYAAARPIWRIRDPRIAAPTTGSRRSRARIAYSGPRASGTDVPMGLRSSQAEDAFKHPPPPGPPHEDRPDGQGDDDQAALPQPQWREREQRTQRRRQADGDERRR